MVDGVDMTVVARISSDCNEFCLPAPILTVYDTSLLVNVCLISVI